MTQQQLGMAFVLLVIVTGGLLGIVIIGAALGFPRLPL